MKIDIYQVVYDSETKANTSILAKECWIDNQQSELYEYQAYLKLLKEKKYQECDYIGVFSSKFCQKTKLSMLDVIEWIKQHPGYDVYTFNPFPYLSYIYYNQWDNGENDHPGLKEVTQKIFEQYSLGLIENTPRIRAIDALYCNFWVGTSQFFEEYIKFIEDLILWMVNQSVIFLEKTLHQGQKQHPFLPFILERMFSHYVLCIDSKIHKSAFLYPNEFSDYVSDNLSSLDCEKRRMLLKITRPHIDRLDAAYFNHPQYQQQYKIYFNQIKQMALSLINGYQNPEDLLHSLALSSSLYLVR